MKGSMDLPPSEEIRKELQDKLIQACEEIITGRQSFSLVVKGLHVDIPGQAQVPPDDLTLLYEDLKLVGELEEVLHGLLDDEKFLHSLNRWNLLRKRSINFLTNPPQFLNDDNPQLALELQELTIDMQKKASQASSSNISTLAREVDKGTQTDLHNFDPYTLLGRYWQLYWCLVSEMIVDTSTETSALYAIGKAQKMPRLLAAQLAQRFEDIKTLEDLASVERLLNALRFFNRGLVFMPEINEEGMPLRDLPPLPAGQTYPNVIPELDEDALESWHRILINWLTMFAEVSESETHDIGLRRATQDSKKICEDLETLRKIVWPVLKLPLWKPESSLGVMAPEFHMLLEMGAALNEGGLDWANMKAMEIISYLDEQNERLGLADESGGYIPHLFKPYHHILVEAAADVRERALDRVGRQVINILRDRTKSVRRLQDELLGKPQSVESARHVYQALIHTAEEIAKDAIQSGQRKDAIAVWKLIREAARPWAISGRRFPELTPAVNRLWRKLYRQAASQAIKVRFAGRRREAIIVASVLAVVALLALGSIGLSAIRAQTEATEAVVIGTSTLDVPATQRFQTAAARATQLVATSSAYAIAVQESRVSRESTVTEQAVIKITATEEEHLARASTATAQEIAYETAVQQAILDQTATATAHIYILRATYEAILCRNSPSYQSYELSSTPDLFPKLGTRYFVGTSPFTVTASWTITNTSECRWGHLGLLPLSEESDYDVTLSLQRSNGEEFNIGPENTVAVSETIRLSINFDPIQAYNVDEEWVLVVNNQEMAELPHLSLDVRGWVVPVYPPTRTPTPEDENGG